MAVQPETWNTLLAPFLPVHLRNLVGEYGNQCGTCQVMVKLHDSTDCARHCRLVFCSKQCAEIHEHQKLPQCPICGRKTCELQSCSVCVRTLCSKCAIVCENCGDPFHESCKPETSWICGIRECWSCGLGQCAQPLCAHCKKMTSICGECANNHSCSGCFEVLHPECWAAHGCLDREKHWAASAKTFFAYKEFQQANRDF